MIGRGILGRPLRRGPVRRVGPVALLLVGLVTPLCAGQVISNDRYQVQVTVGGAAAIGLVGDPRTVFVDPRLLVQRRGTDPGLATIADDFAEINYRLNSWVDAGGVRTPDVFDAEPPAVATASVFDTDASGVTWTMSGTNGLDATVRLSVPPGHGMPILDIHLTATSAGWFGVTFAGIEDTATSSIDEVWQPMVWSERRLPDRSYLTLAYRCPLPMSAVRRADGLTFGVTAGAGELPFQPLPTSENSRFGVLLRDEAGLLRPMIAPVAFGASGSYMSSGEQRSFRSRVLVEDGRPDEAAERVARELFGFGDRRENLWRSTNETIDNIVAYALGAFGGWDAGLKAQSFRQDFPGSVKNSTATYPAMMALVRDDGKLWRERAQPTWEFMLSRREILFALDAAVAGVDNTVIDGPATVPSEYGAMHALTGAWDRTNVEYAIRMAGEEGEIAFTPPLVRTNWQTYMAVFEATRDLAWRDLAVAGALDYIAERVDERATGWTDRFSGSAFFWAYYAPFWMDLYRLYELTNDQRFLDASHEAARRFAMHVYLAPTIPAGDVTVNPGGEAPVYSFFSGRDPLPAAERDVPAWWVSELGLTSEGSGTSHGHRAIMVPWFADTMLRLAEETGDTFLRDIARSSAVGRSTSFPGYHINTARTDVYLREDYPERPFEELSYNTFHFNHVWPTAGLLQGWLIAQAWARSDGAIDFPASYGFSTAYYFNRAYGLEPGAWHGDGGVRLWMPAGLVDTGDPQVDFVAARGGSTLYVALLNQSASAVSTTVALDAARAGFAPASDLPAETRTDNGPPAAATVRGGELDVTVPGKGIVSLAIETGSAIVAPFQDRAVNPSGSKLPPGSWLEDGDLRAMILGPGPERPFAFVYLMADDDDYESVALTYETLDGTRTETDEDYPFEFTVPLAATQQEFRFATDRELPGGGTTSTPWRSLVVGAGAAPTDASGDGRVREAQPGTSAPEFDLAVGPVADGDAFRSYMQFDLSGLTSVIDNATLEVTVNRRDSSSQPASMRIVAFGAQPFDEATLTWSTQPTAGAVLAESAVLDPSAVDSGEVISFGGPALTDAVRSSAGGTLAVGLRTSPEEIGGRGFFWLDSSEDAGAPRLVLNEPCSPRDIASPAGVIDGADVLDFVERAASGDALADLATPAGVTDVFDVLEYLELIEGGCPATP